MIKIGIIPTLLTILLVVACTAEPTPTPVPTPYPTLTAIPPTATPYPTYTPYPTLTAIPPTATPTITPVPTHTPIPTPTSIPLPTATPMNTPIPTPIPTPTQTPTPTARPLLQGQFPPLPSEYYGSVTIEGTPAPDGVTIEVRVLWYTKSVNTFGGGYQGLVVSPNDWTMDARQITFHIGGTQANETTMFTGNVYAFTELDLSFPALTD